MVLSIPIQYKIFAFLEIQYKYKIAHLEINSSVNRELFFLHSVIFLSNTYTTAWSAEAVEYTGCFSAEG